MMAKYELTAEMNLKNIIAESREVAQALAEFADNLEKIEKKYAEPSSSENPNKSKKPTGSTTDAPENNVGSIEPTTKNDLAVDCISRKAALDITWHDPSYSDPLNVLTEVRDKIKALPSVTPIRPKGHWIYDYISADGHRVYHCSECGCYLKPKTSEYLSDYKWCSLCGAEMKESEEE